MASILLTQDSVMEGKSLLSSQRLRADDTPQSGGESFCSFLLEQNGLFVRFRAWK
jgi:hypothetical protein